MAVLGPFTLEVEGALALGPWAPGRMKANVINELSATQRLERSTCRELYCFQSRVVSSPFMFGTGISMRDAGSLSLDTMAWQSEFLIGLDGKG